METSESTQSANISDLSFISKPIGDLFGDLPVDSNEYNRYLLSEDQIAFYKANGYLTDVRVLSDEQCDRLLDEYKKFLLWNNKVDSDGKNDAQFLEIPEKSLLHEYHSNQSTDPNNVVTHMLGHWRISSLFHDLVFLPSVTVPASQLLAAVHPSKESMLPVQFWHDQLFAKPPHHGGPVAWHQDYSYWTRTVPMQHITVHIALDEQTVENGTVHYIPGSHRWHRLNKDGEEIPLPITDIDFSDMESIKKALTKEEIEQFQPQPSLLKKGYASFHHPLSVHGSYPNRTSSPRRAAVLNFFVEGTRSNTDEPLLFGVPVIPRGEPVRNRFFPLAFDPKWMS